ncbi:MAG TPA: hypothetical protein VNG31_00490, partial [Candidatus Baltobacteraceae bacterium]|nr:hypothetical protein [Candidatus Baltobacteraceae bacterium]
TAAAMIGVAWAWRAWLAHCCLTTLFASYEENLPGYLDIFACGMIAAHVYVRYGRRVRESRLRWAAPLVATGAIVALIELLQNLFGYRLADQWAGAWQIDKRPLLGATFALLAVAFLTSPRLWQMLLDNPPLRFCAAISYNLYLYHQMIARELLAWRVPPYVGDPHYDPQWQARYTEIAFAVTILQAAVVTYLFERPLLRLQPPHIGALRRSWGSKANEARASSKRSSP